MVRLLVIRKFHFSDLNTCCLFIVVFVDLDAELH